MDLQAWIIKQREGNPKLWERLEVSRIHLYRIQSAKCMPSTDLAGRIAAMMNEDGIVNDRGESITAGQVIDHQQARMAAIFKDRGSEIWPDAPWAIKEAKP